MSLPEADMGVSLRNRQNAEGGPNPEVEEQNIVGGQLVAGEIIHEHRAAEAVAPVEPVAVQMEQEEVVDHHEPGGLVNDNRLDHHQEHEPDYEEDVDQFQADHQEHEPDAQEDVDQFQCRC